MQTQDQAFPNAFGPLSVSQLNAAGITTTTLTSTTVSTDGTGSGTSASPHKGFAGRTAVQNGASAIATLSKDIYNVNVLLTSIIIPTVERDANSNASGTEYVVNLAYNSGSSSRYITAGSTFRVDVQRKDGSLIPANNGVTINYLIINI